MKLGKLFLLTFFLLMYSGCGITGVKPNGFAEYQSWFSGDHKSISAGGIVFKVQKFKPRPQAPVNFWKEAVLDQMTASGYVFVDSAGIKDSKNQGAWVEFAVPIGQKDYSYLVAVFTRGEKITLVETAGEVSVFQKKKSEILEAIAKIKI